MPKNFDTLRAEMTPEARARSLEKARRDMAELASKCMGHSTNRSFVSAEATIAELETKAAECEKRATHEQEQTAATLIEEAKLYREWIARLQSGRWTA